MSIILLNLQSNQQIKLNGDSPFIIGRGNVEGCFDKRVSRSHGRITCTVDGKVRIEALHCNPCFFTRNGVPPVIQINKDEEETLNEGDYLGLLPNAFWFKITTDKEITIKEEPTEIKTEIITDDDEVDDNNTTVTVENGSVSVEKNAFQSNIPCSSSHVQNKDNSVTQPVPTSSSASCSNFIQTSDIENTRRLPLWMYEIDHPVNSGNKRPLSNQNETNRKKQKVSGDVEVKVEVDISDIPSTSRAEIIDENSTSETDRQAGKNDQSKSANKKDGYESEVNDTGGNVSRPICQYEGRCYRKNPQHKLEFSHPGDADYVSYEERPVCSYGATCYRKNVKHRVEFRHPPPGPSFHNPSSLSSCSRGTIASSPLPAKRKRKKVSRDNSDYGDDDEYDLEDPFINDASSDEYVPSDLDLEDEEEEEEDLSVFGED